MLPVETQSFSVQKPLWKHRIPSLTGPKPGPFGPGQARSLAGSRWTLQPEEVGRPKRLVSGQTREMNVLFHPKNGLDRRKSLGPGPGLETSVDPVERRPPLSTGGVMWRMGERTKNGRKKKKKKKKRSKELGVFDSPRRAGDETQVVGLSDVETISFRLLRQPFHGDLQTWWVALSF